LTRIADSLAAASWLAIAGYFVFRFAKYRKLVSLMLSFMALGWASACLDGVFNFGFDSYRGAVALALAASVGYAIVRVERTGR
jgi:hypothetical protein